MVEVMILSIVVSVIIVEIKSTRSPRHVGNVCLEEELGVCTMLYALAIHWDSSTVECGGGLQIASIMNHAMGVPLRLNTAHCLFLVISRPQHSTSSSIIICNGH